MAKTPDSKPLDSDLEPWERELQETQAKLAQPATPVKVPPIAAKVKEPKEAAKKLPITKVPGPQRKFQ